MGYIQKDSTDPDRSKISFTLNVSPSQNTLDKSFITPSGFKFDLGESSFQFNDSGLIFSKDSYVLKFTGDEIIKTFYEF